MMTGTSVHRADASFRDPSGFLLRRGGILYRQVNETYRPHYERFMVSGLYEALVGANQLVPHDEVDTALAADGRAYKVLQPRELPFISYPYEWCFSQLRDAALLTLAIAKSALAHGMTLKDASAYNVQILDGRPVFIDTLSFEVLEAGKPWVAYRQFCQHFLAPLALMSYTDVRLGQLLRIHLDGVPLDLASRLLPTRTRLTLSLGLHIHAHARAQRKYADQPAKLKQSRLKFSRRAFEGLIDSLTGAVQKLRWRPDQTQWSHYYQSMHNYAQEGLAHKETLVDEMLESVPHASVWDLGANTGRFSQIAARRGALTVSWDIDPGCVEANYLELTRQRAANRLSLWLDLTNPSGGIGWANCERMSLAQRGPVDTILALGLIHHLAISANVPLQRVAHFLAQLCRCLIIEFVPKEDSQVQRLLSSRRDVFDQYHSEGFKTAFSQHFSIERFATVEGTCRTLYLLKKKADT